MCIYNQKWLIIGKIDKATYLSPKQARKYLYCIKINLNITKAMLFNNDDYFLVRHLERVGINITLIII